MYLTQSEYVEGVLADQKALDELADELAAELGVPRSEITITTCRIPFDHSTEAKEERDGENT